MRNTPAGTNRTETIGDVAREARTALGSIVGYTEILTEDLEMLGGNDGAIEDLGKIRDACNRVMTLVTYLEDQADSARELAGRDPLTGIPNRRTLMAKGEVLFRSDAPLSLLVIDVDRFKEVNDRFGHLIGDEVLKIVVERCRRAVRDTDFVARFAGDEFVILLPNTGGLEATRVAARVLHHVTSTPFATSNGDVAVSVSIGVATRTDEQTMEGLMARADHAMYRSKHVGGASLTHTD